MTINHQQALLSEYDNAHSMFQHYDSFRWQSGAILIAAAVVLWGLLFSRAEPPSVLAVSITGLFVSLLLSCWLLYAFHYRQLYMTKLYRIHQVETQMGMNLNSLLGFYGDQRGAPSKRVRPVYFPKGHQIDVVVFVLTSSFGPLYKLLELWEEGAIRKRSTLLLFLPLTIMIVTIILVNINERRMVKWYMKHPLAEAIQRNRDLQSAADRLSIEDSNP